MIFNIFNDFRHVSRIYGENVEIYRKYKIIKFIENMAIIFRWKLSKKDDFGHFLAYKEEMWGFLYF